MPRTPFPVWHLVCRSGPNTIEIEDRDFDRLIAAGMPSRFTQVAASESVLRLPHASLNGDLRLSPGGRYEWLFCGEVDTDGRALK